MFKKIKNWIIKKLGGHTDTEYKRLLAIADNMTTLKFTTSIPGYIEYPDFDVQTYALMDIMEKIINTGALHLHTFPNYCGNYTDVIYTLKIVV